MILRHACIFFVLLGLICNKSVCYAGFRTYTFKHLTENIALKQSNVNSIYQDKEGLMYFGTNEGLFVYDGYKSVLCWNNIKVGAELLANDIHSISELSGSDRLISSSDGLYVYNIKYRSFHPIAVSGHWPDEAKVVKVKQQFYCIASSEIGELEIFEQDGNYRAVYHPRNKVLKKWIKNESIDITSHCFSKEGSILLAIEDDQILSWNPHDNQIESLGKATFYLNSLFEDKNGKVWAGTNNNMLLWWNKGTDQPNTIELKINEESYGNFKYITSITEDREGNLLIGTNNNGLAIIRTSEKYKLQPDIEYYPSEPENSNSICDNNVSCLYTDQSNAIFIGTFGNGVSQLSLGQSCFIQHINHINNDNSLDHIRVNGIHDDNNGNIWFGTRIGLNRYNRQTQRYYRYHDLLAGDSNKRPKEVDLIGETTCFCQDSIGNLWIGTYGTGVFMYSYIYDRFYHFKDNEGRLVPTTRITDVSIDNKGFLWIATHGAGMARVDSVDLQNQHLYLKPYRCSIENPHGFASQSIDIIFPDKNNNLWCSFPEKGLFRYNLETDKMQLYAHASGDSTSISNNGVISICSDRDENLWFGTARGLNKFDVESEVFTSYTMERGLPHNSICGVLSDESANIWLYTQRGIYRFNPLTETFDRFIENSRIVHEDKTIDATCKNEDGKLYLGTINNGCFEFHPDSIIDNVFIPKVTFTNFKVSGRSVYELDQNELKLESEIAENGTVNLNYQQNDIAIEYSALAYHSDLNIQLMYRMEGVDNSWNTSDETKLEVSYANLNPGKYTFRVKAKNSLMPDAEKESGIIITIHPPFWATNWAYGLYLIVISLIGFALYRYTVSRLSLKNDLKMERMKLGFFTNVSHEFRTPLTLIAGPLKKLMADDGLKEQDRHTYYNLMHKNTDKLLKLVNQILDIRKVDKGKMALNAEESDIISLAREVFDSFSIIAHEREINYQFKSDSDRVLLWYDEDKLEKVLFNLLSNAFKYSADKSSISLTINKEAHKHEIRIQVTDTGRGIPEDQLGNVFTRFYRVEDYSDLAANGTGLGLSIVKTFVEMHSGSVKVTNNESSGCTFTVTLPLGDQHLLDNQKINQSDKGPVKEFVGKSPSQSLKGTIKENKSDLADEQAPLVLIVEDNEDVRQFIKQELQTSYRIITAINGKEGLDKAVEEYPDLIVSDVMMPEMDGLEFCQKVKEDIRICHIPVVLLTARSSSDQQIEGIETGADAYITKPFDPSYLEARVRNLISSRLLLKQAFSKSLTEPSAEPKRMANSLDEQFIEKATQVVSDNLENPEFSVPEFTQQMGMSNSVFYRKIKAITDLSAGEFIKHIRMQKALELLGEESYTISEIANKVGFNDPKYFSTAFKKTFGKSPKQYLGQK
ncbi:MAG: ATP-binding protein [Carboxylicivirga sp.]|nr:ATP-binding protein [Carboxylicivirga sp.]